MVNVLSQNEIDALLSAISSGEMDNEEKKSDGSNKKVHSYDFKRAVRFSKDHIRSLTRIHENFARYLTTYFSAQLRTFVQINIVQVEQLPYDEFVRSIPKMTILNIFEAEPLEGRMVLEFQPNIAFAMLDRLLGGSSFTPSRINNLTEIDTIVLEHLFSRAILSLQEAWKNIIDIHPQLETLETNPQFIQIVSPNETVALISMSMKIGETTGMINLCIPHVVIEPIMPKLTVNNLFFTQKKNRAPEELEVLQERLNLTSMTIIAELGSSTINVREFLNLAVGDVISLNKQLDETLDIKVGERYKFTGTPGTSKGKLAVQVADFVTEGGKNNDE